MILTIYYYNLTIYSKHFTIMFFEYSHGATRRISRQFQFALYYNIVQSCFPILVRAQNRTCMFCVQIEFLTNTSSPSTTIKSRDAQRDHVVFILKRSNKRWNKLFKYNSDFPGLKCELLCIFVAFYSCRPCYARAFQFYLALKFCVTEEGKKRNLASNKNKLPVLSYIGKKFCSSKCAE